MNPGEAVNALRAACRRWGWAVEVIPAARVVESRSTIEAARDDGLLDEGFYAQDLEGRFSWVAPEDLPDAASVIVVVRPALPHCLTFAGSGMGREVLVGGWVGDAVVVLPP